MCSDASLQNYLLFLFAIASLLLVGGGGGGLYLLPS
jgi:hypothetical protein